LIRDAATAELPTWCEIDLSGLRSNVSALKQTLRLGCILGVVVKADAYGHGMIPCAKAALAAGAGRLIVNDVAEAARLRHAEILDDIYICGPTLAAQAAEVIKVQASVAVDDLSLVEALSQAATSHRRTLPVHIKVETGTHRRGVLPEDVAELARAISERSGLCLEGLTTHLADVEDGDDHQFARQQVARLNEARRRLTEAGFDELILHAASSAAAVVLPESQFDMVRAGLLAYGLLPSETIGPRILDRMKLTPVLSWRARLFPGAPVAEGETIGYGRTYRVGSGPARRQAVLNVGYHEGFDRRRSNRGYVLTGGERAPIRGRICMNMSMVEPPSELASGAVATLIGRDGGEQIWADQIARWTSTINYEVVSRIHPAIPRITH